MSTPLNTPAGDPTGHVPLKKRVRRAVLGGSRNPFDPQIFRHLSLVAFFAWVGMGADGITSANYGPEEAFRALSHYPFLAPLLAVAIAVTVLIISASYTQIIEQFPTGGGGYLVASKLLHPNLGVVSGSALVVDYVLTVAVSVVSGVDSIFSLTPHPLAAQWHIALAVGVILVLVTMNLRGLKESVLAMLPIFMVFVISHVLIVSYGIATHLHDLPARVGAGAQEAQMALSKDGFWVLAFVFLNAFSMGAGTFTGIEAVSNGMLVLREPRVQTGKHTMAYMAASLSFLAAALLINYFLFQTVPVHGKTLNTVLFAQITESWQIGHLHIGQIVLSITVISAALLLFVAAQTGFIDGPRVLANMAQDSWFPHRFSHLSERLVTQNGILLMGAAAIALVLYSRGSIAVLVTLYAINVFITFSLSQLGMLRLWLSRRKSHGDWFGKFLINGTGFLVCITMLVVMIGIKFFKGGWVTLLITSMLVGLCYLIRRHYRDVEEKIRKIDEILMTLNFGESTVTPQPLEPNEPTAVILVEKYSGTGIHVLLNVQRLFGYRYKQYVFVSCGAIDTGHFKGTDELAELHKDVKRQTDKYVTLARSYGLKAESRTGLAIDYLTEIEHMCLDIHREFPNSLFFAARLLFWRDSIWSRFLHNETPLSLQRRLMFHGLQFMVLPVRLQ
jgi:amino acid transporter